MKELEERNKDYEPHTGFIVTKCIILATPIKGVAVGYIMQIISDTPPEGWLFCDGQKISKGEYSDLYKLIGDTYRKNVINPKRKWYQFWRPKYVPEKLLNSFRVPNLNLTVSEGKIK